MKHQSEAQYAKHSAVSSGGTGMWRRLVKLALVLLAGFLAFPPNLTRAQVGQFYRPSHTPTACGTDITAPVIAQTLCFDQSTLTNYVWAAPGQWNILSSASGAVGIVPPAGDIGGTTSAPTITAMHFGTNQVPTRSVTPSTGQCMFYDGVGLNFETCPTGAGIVPPAGDLGGSTTTPTVVQLHWGSTGIPLSATAPTSGQCVQYNGTSIVGAACGSGGGITCKGTATLVSGMATVSAACVTSTQNVLLQPYNDNALVGYYGLVAGTGFTIWSQNPFDTSTVGWGQLQ